MGLPTGRRFDLHSRLLGSTPSRSTGLLHNQSVVLGIQIARFFDNSVEPTRGAYGVVVTRLLAMQKTRVQLSLGALGPAVWGTPKRASPRIFKRCGRPVLVQELGCEPSLCRFNSDRSPFAYWIALKSIWWWNLIVDQDATSSILVRGASFHIWSSWIEQIGLQVYWIARLSSKQLDEVRFLGRLLNELMRCVSRFRYASHCAA